MCVKNRESADVKEQYTLSPSLKSICCKGWLLLYTLNPLGDGNGNGTNSEEVGAGCVKCS